MARLKTFSIDLGEWSPAAWNGIALARPVPIHQIRGRPLSNCCTPNLPSMSTCFTQTFQSQDKYFRNSLLLRPRSWGRILHSLFNQLRASEADKFGRSKLLI